MYINLEAMSLVKYLNDRQTGSVSVDLSAKIHSIGSISEQLAEDKATIPSKNQVGYSHFSLAKMFLVLLFIPVAGHWMAAEMQNTVFKF